jgi:hypothetical protein
VRFERSTVCGRRSTRAGADSSYCAALIAARCRIRTGMVSSL